MDKVIQGDCLEVLKTLESNSVDAVITDPPYNTGMTKKNTANSTWLNSFFDDSLSIEDYTKLAEGFAEETYRVTKQDSAMYVFINWKSYDVWFNAVKRFGWKVKNCIVWDKVVHGLNYQNYAYTHEFIIFCTKGNFKPKNKPGELWKDVWHIKRMMGKKRDDLKHETIKVEDVIKAPIEHSTILGGGNFRPVCWNWYYRCSC